MCVCVCVCVYVCVCVCNIIFSAIFSLGFRSFIAYQPSWII